MSAHSSARLVLEWDLNPKTRGNYFCHNLILNSHSIVNVSAHTLNTDVIVACPTAALFQTFTGVVGV